MQQPLVLVFDDLQWADVGSLELLEAIVSDPQSKDLALVGMCCSNEVLLSHDFAMILCPLEDERDMLITLKLEVYCCMQPACLYQMSLMRTQFKGILEYFQ
jgi:predicted ATPase